MPTCPIKRALSLACAILVTQRALFGQENSFQTYTQSITNPFRTDGFGAQFLLIICSAIYAELNGKQFCYTPFKIMEHNYDNDPKFIEKKERLINFIGNFEVNEDLSIQPPENSHEYYKFFLDHLTLAENSNSLKNIKYVFRKNKNKQHYFKNETFNIAVHIRRPNSHDTRPEGPDIPDEAYLRNIEFLRKAHASENPLFHIYSQGDFHTFYERFSAHDTVLHINESIEDTFSSMVLADSLVTSASAFSYAAAVLSEGIIYYIPFWQPPMPNWTILSN